jgi:hypothetical protein
MHRGVRGAGAAIALLASAALLSGCSLLDALYDPGPPRDANGEITETKVVPATTLREGDCFSFLDDGTLEDVTAIPCAEQHTYIVIGQGELTAKQVNDAGGMQNAVSAACAPEFEVFKAAVAEGAPRPDLEFLVANLEHDGQTWSAYSCVATDGAVAADG